MASPCSSVSSQPSCSSSSQDTFPLTPSARRPLSVVAGQAPQASQQEVVRTLGKSIAHDRQRRRSTKSSGKVRWSWKQTCEIEKAKAALLCTSPPIQEEASCSSDNLVLEIQSVESFLAETGLELIGSLTNSNMANLVDDLNLYHQVRVEKDSILLQQRYLKKIMKDCVIASSSYDPKKSAREKRIRNCLRSLYQQVETKHKYLKALRFKLKQPLTEIGVVGDAKLEAVDPLNRGWAICSTIWQKAHADILSRSPNAAKNIEVFFKEVEGYPWKSFSDSLQNLKSCQVRYLNAEERAEYQVSLVRPDPNLPTILMKNGIPFDTSDSWAIKQGVGMEIFVFKNDQLYAGRHEIGVLHHSSFYAGGPVDCEGELRCRDGRLISINLQSGHYKPTRRDAKDFLNWLENNGIDLENVPIDTVETVRFPIKVYQKGVPEETITYFKAYALVSYNARQLREELNGADLAPRSSRLNGAKLVADAKCRYDNKFPGNSCVLQAPVSMAFDLKEGDWSFEYGPKPIIFVDLTYGSYLEEEADFV